MPRVVVLNNYSFQRVFEQVRRGDKPAHHLYGIDRFPGLGFEVDDVPVREAGLPLPLSVRRAIGLFPPLGNLRQQAAALFRLRRADLIYAPCQTQTQLFAYLRSMGLLNVPIVTLAHHPISRDRWPWKRAFLRLQLGGTDAFPSLSQTVAGEIADISEGRTQSETVPWGPDLDYYPKPDGTPGAGAIAAGRTGRDFLTYARAAATAGVKASVLCLRADGFAQTWNEPSARVSVTAVDDEGDLSYRRLVPLLANARVHAIPLAAGTSLSGLTSLTDALGVGKPVIMTRHPLIDIDIEKENIGRWVSPGDVPGWVEALRWFDDHPEESAAMGLRARMLAERLYNIDTFAQRMVRIFRSVLSRAS
jgi:hypothetical protein